MLQYVSRRLLAVPVVLFGVTFLVFCMIHLAPGDATTALLGPMATDEAREALRESLGLNRPLSVQYVTWLGALASGDLGTSLVARRPVADIVLSKFLNTALLALTAASFAYILGVTAGILAAVRENSIYDRVLGTTTMVFGTTPTFWLSLVLVWYFSLTLRWFPATGMWSARTDAPLLDFFRHVALPMVAAGVPTAAIVARVVRSSMLEVLSQPFILVARARGVPRSQLIFGHALRNALPPIVTVCGTEAGYLIGGVVFVEVVFAWPGIGQQLYTSITGRDLPVVQAAVLLIALGFVLINLLADVVNMIIDPRLRSGKTA
ncbi:MULTISPECIES: ABC transporter permease [unclassified Rhizobium]|uniref:ABC transporter permease n=1 Tax=unclassified Rhizobium TaxID=2613769 RepID=UPI00247AFA3B|nr:MULTISPECIES: ABC transporter permease [unclassified Rhizobium]MDH7804559.1 peptide/nickel transport system permease protein [Rhizobium sp. AN70]